jgi:hypothetical protein
LPARDRRPTDPGFPIDRDVEPSAPDEAIAELTDREREVMERVALGFTNHEVDEPDANPASKRAGSAESVHER